MELELDGAFDQAINLPLGELEERKDEVLSIDGPVILFCKSGNRSGRALEFLELHGLQSGYNGGGFIQLHTLIESL
jgi:phage shock protein E